MDATSRSCERITQWTPQGRGEWYAKRTYEQVLHDVARDGVRSPDNLPHSAAVIHRDIKPHNLFLTSAGVVKVMDFGIARRSASQITAIGDKSIVGTPMYLSPEHLADHPSIDHRTDIYSLGTTMYHLLTDQLPWDTKDLASLFVSVLHSDVPAPSTFNDKVPPALDAIVMRAMSRKVDRRFQTCDELRNALRTLQRNYAPM